jgi:2-polyprenyl-3-methyl-5-hydroxy-6-metoxy-1,4-benzoquinol methylase
MKEKYIDFQNIPFNQAIQTFIHLIAEEICFRKSQNLDSSYLELKYENNLFDADGNSYPVRVEGYKERLFLLINLISELRGQATVLDVGCGCGSESLLMSLLGADVTGIDLISHRTEFAQSRIPFYQSFSEHELQIQFSQANIFNFLPSAPKFNIIWMVESISHVHPAEDFLQLAFNSLPDNGFLILADSNALNPVSLFRACQLRGFKKWYTYEESTDMENNHSVKVAEERIFTFLRLRKMLEKVGFQIQNFNIAGFLGSYFIPRKMLPSLKLAKSLITLQNILKKTPVLRLFGSNFTLVAIKRENNTIK